MLHNQRNKRKIGKINENHAKASSNENKEKSWWNRKSLSNKTETVQQQWIVRRECHVIYLALWHRRTITNALPFIIHTSCSFCLQRSVLRTVAFVSASLCAYSFCTELESPDFNMMIFMRYLLCRSCSFALVVSVLFFFFFIRFVWFIVHICFMCVWLIKSPRSQNSCLFISLFTDVNSCMAN